VTGLGTAVSHRAASGRVGLMIMVFGHVIFPVSTALSEPTKA
jgi:hypothetical protein